MNQFWNVQHSIPPPLNHFFYLRKVIPLPIKTTLRTNSSWLITSRYVRTLSRPSFFMFQPSGVSSQYSFILQSQFRGARHLN